VIVGKKGFAIDYQVFASNSPTNYTLPGLPQYLNINSGNGNIYGLPMFSGVFDLVLNVSNSSGTTTQDFTVTIEDNVDMTPPTAPVITGDVNHEIMANPLLRSFDIGIVPSEIGGSEVYRYDIWINGTFAIASTSGTILGGWFPELLTIINLQPETQYTVKVRSVDSLGNESPFSNEITVTTI
jgi:hypothetical protein